MSRGTLACVAVLILAGQAQPEDLRPIQLAVYPAKPPTPALKYQLLPELRDQTAGNAATGYRKVAEQLKMRPLSVEEHDAVSEWFQMPLRELPRDKLAALLKKHEAVLRELDAASRCENCDWELTSKLRQDGMKTLLLPEAIPLRDAASLLRLRARLEVAEGRVNQAVQSLQTLYSLGRHAAAVPVLVNYLMGLSIVQLANKELEGLLETPNSPNMYWPLTDLPSPIIDLRQSIQGERIMIDSLFPGLREAMADPKAAAMGEEQLLAIRKRLIDLHSFFKSKTRLETDVSLTLITGRLYQTARADLLAQGRTAEQVEKLPQFQVVLSYAVSEYDRHHDRIRKCCNIPYWQADETLRETKGKLPEKTAIDFLTGMDKDGISFLPALATILRSKAHLDRKLATLRIVEAIRLYAANHDGKPPASLADIKEVPIPIDPITGKGFEYKLVDGKARLYGPPPPGEEARPHNTVYYELTIKRKAGD